jgi:hypothetical protein
MLQQGGCAERDSAALRALREYVHYTRKLTIPCEHLDIIQSTAQDWLLRDTKETGVTALDTSFVLSQQVDDTYTTTKTSRVAQAVLQELSLLCQDATVGAKASLLKLFKCANIVKQLAAATTSCVLAGNKEWPAEHQCLPCMGWGNQAAGDSKGAALRSAGQWYTAASAVRPLG